MAELFNRPGYWSRFRQAPMSPLAQKTHIMLGSLLACLSFTLACLVFSQQQEIKGMSTLLMKQDTSISQNKQMITQLSVSQNYLHEQLKEIRLQTRNEEFSTQPLVDVHGRLVLKRTSGNIYDLFISLKNSGNRTAEKVNISLYWLELVNGKMEQIFSSSSADLDGIILPMQSRIFAISNLNLTEEAKHRLVYQYVILSITYTDPLTRRKQKMDLFARHQGLFDNELITINTTGKELALLKKFLKKKKK